MSLPPLSFTFTDLQTGWRRLVETINNILNFTFDDSRARTAAEITAGVTPTNYAYPPGHAWRYGAVGDGVTDDTAALNRLGSINFPCYIPYTSGNGYKITGTVTLNQNNVVCDGQLYAVGIVSNSGQASGSYTATNPAVIIGGGARSLRVRGLFVEGDPNAKTNNTIAMRVDGSGHVLTECGASQCGWGSVVRGFIMQFTNCTFAFNKTGMSMYGASNPTEINSIIVSGGDYGGNSDFALNIGDTRFSTIISGGNPQGASIRLEGFNCDNAPIQVDNVVAFSARNIYFEYVSLGTAGFILGGSGQNNLKGVDIDSCFFNTMKFGTLVLNSVPGLKVGRANFYTGVTISAVKYSDMTQACHYETGSAVGSFANGQQVSVNFPGQALTTVDFGGCTIESDGLFNGVQYSIDTITKWYPGAAQINAGNRTINNSSLRGVYYTTPATSKAGTLSGNQLTMTTKSDSYLFNGGDRLTGTGAAAAAAICLGVDYDNGIVFLDTTGSGAATISQQTVSTTAAA